MTGSADKSKQNGRVNTDAVQVFTSLLALATLATAVVVATAGLLAPRGVAVAGEVVALVRDGGLWLVAVITTGAMLGSLWFSESVGYVPCKLCWYQRIAMFSLAVLSWVAALRRDKKFWVYSLVAASVGLVISTYHYLVEWFPQLESNVCSVDVPCNAVWFREFGFVTLAFMAGSAFLATIAVSLVMKGASDEQ